MQSDELEWLQRWYLSKCNGEWEHAYGVQIGTLDNPGWTLKIDLTGTNLETKAFPEVEIDRSKHDWVRCALKKERFEGAGGPENLNELIRVFRLWGES